MDLQHDDMNQQGVNAAAAAAAVLPLPVLPLPPGGLPDQEEVPADVHRIRYDTILNEYTQTEVIMNSLWPYLFPNGYPHKGIITDVQMRHMLNQASLVYSDNPTFISFLFNLQHRRQVSKSVSFAFKSDKSTLDELRDLLNDNDFKGLLEEAIAHPKSTEAKDMEKYIHSLVSMGTSKVSYTGRASSAAFADALAMGRFFGQGAFFLTLAPQSWKLSLFYRYVQSVLTNAGDLMGTDLGDIIPDTNGGRKAMKMAHPYADVHTFQKLITSIFTNLLQIPVPIMLSNVVTSSPEPARYRQRGILGEISAMFTAIETSTSGELHSHSKCFTPINWEYLRSIAQYPHINKAFGAYLDSIIQSELSFERSWDKKPQPSYPNPVPMFLKTEDVPMPTTTIMPIGRPQHQATITEAFIVLIALQQYHHSTWFSQLSVDVQHDNISNEVMRQLLDTFQTEELFRTEKQGNVGLEYWLILVNPGAINTRVQYLRDQYPELKQIEQIWKARRDEPMCLSPSSRRSSQGDLNWALPRLSVSFADEFIVLTALQKYDHDQGVLLSILMNDCYCEVKNDDVFNQILVDLENYEHLIRSAHIPNTNDIMIHFNTSIE